MALPVGVDHRGTLERAPYEAAATTARRPASFVWNEKLRRDTARCPAGAGTAGRGRRDLESGALRGRGRGRSLVPRLPPRGLHLYAPWLQLARACCRNRVSRRLICCVVIVLATTALAFTAGAWVVASAFLYLQWFHYMRQGYGISRMYFRYDARRTGRRRARPRRECRDLRRAHLRHRSPVDDDGRHVPGDAGQDDRAAAGGRHHARPSQPRWRSARGSSDGPSRRGRAPPTCATRDSSSRTSSSSSCAYVWIDDANVGWLAINIWHNLQYVLVVWMVNVKTIRGSRRMRTNRCCRESASRAGR